MERRENEGGGGAAASLTEGRRGTSGGKSDVGDEERELGEGLWLALPLMELRASSVRERE